MLFAIAERKFVQPKLLKLKLASTVGTNKKFFFKVCHSKRRMRENVGPLVVDIGHLTDKDIGKAGIYNVFFNSLSIDEDLWEPQSPDLEVCNYSDELPANSELMQYLFREMGAQMSMESDGTHPRILKDLADITVISQWSWESGDFLVERKLRSIVTAFKKGKKDLGNYRPASVTSDPGKIMKKIILGVTETHLKDNAVIGLN